MVGFHAGLKYHFALGAVNPVEEPDVNALAG